MQAFKSSGIQERTSGGREIAPARPIPTLYSALNMTLSETFFSSKASSQIWVEKKKARTKGAGSVQKKLEQCISMLEARFCSNTVLPRLLHLTQNMALCFYFRPNIRCFAPKQNLRKGKSQHRLGHGHGHGKERKVVTCPNHPYILMQHLRSKWF